MNVSLFTQCMVDMFYPQVGKAAVEVLEHLGCKVDIPKKQTCCGQPLINSGHTQAAKASMKNTICAFEDAQTIVSLSGSCAFAIKHEYKAVFKDEPVWQMRAEKVANRIYEFSDFIANVLNKSNVDAIFPYKVTYHMSCHATRLLNIKEAPLHLLNHVQGLTYIEMNQADRCCGFGGTFSVKQSALSEEIVAQKVANIIASDADVVCGIDQACLMNIAGYIERLDNKGQLPRPIKVMHLAEILNAR